MQVSALETAKGYEREAIARIRRMNIAAADLEVKGQKKGSLLHSAFGNGNDSQMEESIQLA